MQAETSPDGIPYAALVRSSAELLSVHDAEGVVRYVNDACEQLLGLPAPALVGTNPFALVHHDDRDELVAQLVRLLAHPGQVQVLQVRVRHADGTFRRLESRIRNGLQDPALQAVLVTTRELSERLQTTEALRATESRYRELVDGVPVGLAVVDDQGLVRFANPAAHRLAGLDVLDDLLGQPVAALVRPDERERCAAALRRALVDQVAPGPARYRLNHSDGVITSAPLPHEWEGQPAALLLLQDVSALLDARDQSSRVTEQLQGILEATADGVVGVDQDGLITFMNPAAAALLNLDPVRALGLSSHALYHHSSADGTPNPQEDCPCLRPARGGAAVRLPGEILWRSDGTALPVDYRALPLRGDRAGAVITFHDVSERLRNRERLARLAGFQSAVLDSMLALTAVIDNDGRIIAVNEAWTRQAISGGGSPATCGTGVDFFAVCDHVSGPSRPDALAVASGLRSVLTGASQEFQQDIPCELEDSHLYYSLSIVPLHVPEGGAVLSYTDITRRKTLEVAAAHRATHDVLTGLPNRTLLLDRLQHALSGRGPAHLAVLFLDLDAFKLVNDGYGHEAGDEVLRELAARLVRQVRPSDTVARLAGDEFVVLCEDLATPGEADVLAERLLAAVAEPFTIADEGITLGLSIGIAVADATLNQPDALLNAADQAMFDAKARGRNRVTVYDAGVHGRHHVRLAQAMTLRGMVERDDLLVHYQPLIDLRDGSLEGAEALLRWRGVHALPDTATAIALAEEIGLIGRIGRFVLREAMGQAATFLTPGGVLLPLAVNLAPQQLEPSLVGFVEQAAQDAGFPLTSLTLELTERSVMTDPVGAVGVLKALRARGVRIALDDFGVGYSSLASLRDLPLDVLKIDAGFVQGLLGPEPNGRIITAIVEMARALDLDIVAEGIEQDEQRDRLLELGCEHGQGFLFSPACSPRQLRALAR